MAFRMRKSLNLGGGFKINLSKSGIGYSFGIPGIRYTQMANGRQRTTYSIPGTGLSYVEEGGKKKQKTQHQEKTVTANFIEQEEVSTININDNQDNDSNICEFITAINNFKKKDLTTKVAIILFTIILAVISANNLFIVLGLFLLIIYIIYRNKKLLIRAQYDFDEANQESYEYLNSFFKELCSCNKLWLIKSQSHNLDTKRNAGANIQIIRSPVTIVKKLPYYLNANIECYCIKLTNTALYFLPDKVLIDTIDKTSSMDLEQFIFDFDNVIFVEEEDVPYDSQIVDYTWKYVNKNGSPDKRFNDNPKYPKCSYGIVEIKNNSGINISILTSSAIKKQQAELYYNRYVNISRNLYKFCLKCNEKISKDANFCKKCGIKQ